MPLLPLLRRLLLAGEVKADGFPQLSAEASTEPDLKNGSGMGSGEHFACNAMGRTRLPLSKARLNELQTRGTSARWKAPALRKMEGGKSGNGCLAIADNAAEACDVPPACDVLPPTPSNHRDVPQG